MTFTIEGAPRTKKNSQRIARVKGRPIVLQSRQHDAWAQGAILQLRSQWRRCDWAVDFAVNLRAHVYRDRAVGDLLNYLAAVSDALEAAGVVANDRLIVSLDGSRLLVDRARPRVEIELSPVEE